MTANADIGAVLIGRNEGARLIACLKSFPADMGGLVYVDSGSTDDSVAQAQALGAQVISLDMTQPFTAARARNVGLEALLASDQPPTYVQFIDGDCELRLDWLETARAYLDAHPDVAVVCGRRRERAPQDSIYNAMIDAEWDTPVGEAKACGGDALMRVAALNAVGHYNPTLIAGEEPELCVRLRQAGWKIWRLDAEMTWHDAALTRFGQWWNRTRRAGHAYAEGAAMHGAPPEQHFVRETRRAVLWGIVLPLVALVGALITPYALVLFLLWPLQMLRLKRKGFSLAESVFLPLGKLPEGIGVLQYWQRRLMRGQATLIEYK